MTPRVHAAMSKRARRRVKGPLSPILAIILDAGPGSRRSRMRIVLKCKHTRRASGRLRVGNLARCDTCRDEDRRHRKIDGRGVGLTKKKRMGGILLAGRI